MYNYSKLCAVIFIDHRCRHTNEKYNLFDSQRHTMRYSGPLHCATVLVTFATLHILYGEGNFVQKHNEYVQKYKYIQHLVEHEFIGCRRYINISM